MNVFGAQYWPYVKYIKTMKKFMGWFFSPLVFPCVYFGHCLNDFWQFLTIENLPVGAGLIFVFFLPRFFFFFNLSLAGWEKWIVGVSPTPLSSAVSLLFLPASGTEEEEKKFLGAKRSWFVSSSAMDMWSSVSHLDSWNLIQNGNNHSTCLDPSGANQETEATQRWNREGSIWSCIKI